MSSDQLIVTVAATAAMSGFVCITYASLKNHKMSFLLRCLITLIGAVIVGLIVTAIGYQIV